MSDIFISYASADRERAQLLARALQERGWSVWWDRTIPPGRQFDEVIEEALDAARCVVVLWSKASTASGWVKTEAAEAMRRKALIPALIDEAVKIPLEFRRLQAADLTRWHGAASTPEFEQFCAAIAAGLAGGVEPQPAPPPYVPPHVPPYEPPGPAPAPPAKTAKRWPWIVGGVGGVLVAVAAMVDSGTSGTWPANGGNGGGSVGPGALTYPTAAAMPISQTLGWRDYVLLYSGRVEWDGRSPFALAWVTVKDGNTLASLVNNQRLDLVARLDAPGRMVFSGTVPVPGDSETPGAHVHPINLVFETPGNGQWLFVRNCMQPGRCFPAGS
ncbi:MAG: toll/interleukin-1 receptor domain-containing protein [Caldimonas sp.]